MSDVELCLPETMQIAEGINCFHRVPFAQGEAGAGRVTWRQLSVLAALLGLKTDPFNIVFRSHGMLHSSDGNRDLIPLYLQDGDVFLLGRVGGAGNDLLHRFSAAIHRDAAVSDHGDDIATVPADEKFLFHKLPPFKQSVSEIS